MMMESNNSMIFKTIQETVDKTKNYQKIHGTYTLYSDRKEIVLTPQEWNMYNKIIDQINYKVH